jgi:MFS superfamily sulfate permease-like transporter
VVGTVAACLAVAPRRAYLIIPAPALAYLVAAIVAGLIHDRATDTSHTLLALNAARWVASGFVAMVAATALAVLIAGVRWLRASRRTVSRAAPYRQAPPSAPGRRQPPARSPRQGDASDQGQRRLPR